MSQYPKVPLGEVLRPSREAFTVEPDREYRTAGVFSFGKGLFKRDPILGAETSYKKLTPIRAGQLVFGRLNAWEGGIAVVQREFDGLVVSQEFPVLDPDLERVEPAYLAHLCRWPELWQLLMTRARGLGARTGVRRLRVHEERVFEVEVPLPDIAEQRRVASRLDAQRAHADRIRTLGVEAATLASALLVSLTHVDAPEARVGDVIHQVRREAAVMPQQDYRLLGVKWYAQGLFVREVKAGLDIAAKKLYRIEAGDFVYNRLFAWKGSFAVAGEDSDGCYVSGEFPVFVADSDAVDVNYLLALFRDPSAWARAELRSTGGTPTSRNRLKEGEFLALEVPLPSIDAQRRIATIAENVATSLATANRREAFLNALQVSMLNHAFAGLP